MIPVLGVPTLARYDLLEKMIGSIDVPVDKLLVIDNGGSCPELPGAQILHLSANLGVAAAWNLVLKASPLAPWWALVNDDIVFGKGDLEMLASRMTAEPGIVTVEGFAAFGINRSTVERVGYFDENFHPAYCEDADYEYRCKLAGVPIIELDARNLHSGSATIALSQYRKQNDRTYPQNLVYYEAKWGGPLRGGETFDSPFNRGGDVGDWRLSVERIRTLAWQP